MLYSLCIFLVPIFDIIAIETAFNEIEYSVHTSLIHLPIERSTIIKRIIDVCIILSSPDSRESLLGS